MKNIMLGLLCLSFSLNAFAKKGGKEEILQCRDLEDGTLYGLYQSVGSNQVCHDALNLLSIFNEDALICYNGKAKKARKQLAAKPITFQYYGQYTLEAFLSDQDTGGDTILFQIREFEGSKSRVVHLVGKIEPCSASEDLVYEDDAEF